MSDVVQLLTKCSPNDKNKRRQVIWQTVQAAHVQV